MKRISLFYRDSATNSDKVYIAEIVDAGGGEYRVNFQFGRRGTTLAEGTKTRVPVSLALAENIYAKLVAEKRGKGYTEESSGKPFGGDVGKLAEVLPHPSKKMIDAGKMQALIHRSEGVCQRKYDGELSRLDIGDGNVLLGERMRRRKSGGFYTAQDHDCFNLWEKGWFVAFTVEMWHGENVLSLPEHLRADMLDAAQLPTGVILAERVHNVAAVMESGAEGVCWRAWGSAWGEMSCHKVNTIYTCRVSSVGNKQSVGIVDAATGVDRGRLTLNGGACDQVRVNSILRCEAMGEHDGGKLRQAVKCREWLLKY